MAAGRLDEQRVREAAQVLLEHRRDELPNVSVAVAARLLGVSRTTVESWRQAGVLTSAAVRRRRHEVTIDSLVRLQVLQEELRRLGKGRELRDYVWWSAQDTADYADGMLAEALRQLRAGNSARSTCLRRKTLTGHAVNSMIQARGSEADGHDCSYAAGPRADRVTARQSQSRAPISRRGHTPARVRGRGCTAGSRRALGRLQAGSLRRVASPDCFRGTGSVHPAARRRAHAHSQPLPAVVCSAGHRRAGGAPHQAAVL